MAWFDGALQHSPVFLPDIGTYFNQDIEVAKSLVDQLADAGVRYVKGEVLHTPEICLPAEKSGNEKYWGNHTAEFHSENYRALIERKVIPLSVYQSLFDYIYAKNLQLIVSVYDFEGVDFALKNNVAAIKVASSNITHQPLIEYIAAQSIPMILDTGHSTMEEAARAVNWAKDAGAIDLLIEHSPPGPPNSTDKHNLKFMQTLGNAMGLPFGLSDHYSGHLMLLAATAMGATILEKGVCPDDLADEQDGAHALPISEVATILSAIHEIYIALGSGIRELPRQRDKYVSRMGLVAKTDVHQGEKLSINNVDFAFPALGIKAEYWSEVNHQTFNKSLVKGDVIHWSDIAFR